MWFIVSVAVAGTPTHDEIESAPWAAIGDKDHNDAGKVQLYTANVQGVDCYRAVATTEVSADVLFGIITNPEAAKDWSSANITEAVILSRSGNRIEYYQHLSTPGWTMMADRFWFSAGEFTETEALKAWRYKLLANGGAHTERYAAHRAKHPKAIEPTTSVGGWYFKPTGGQTEVTFMVCADIGGSIPGAVERFATRRTLPDTVGDMVREGRKRSR